MSGQFDRALDDYDHAANGDNREFHAKGALAAIELQLNRRNSRRRTRSKNSTICALPGARRISSSAC